jgi:hypothetical protein
MAIPGLCACHINPRCRSERRTLARWLTAQTQQLCHQPPNDRRRLNTSIPRAGRNDLALLLTFRLLDMGSGQAEKSQFASVRISLF